jgi:thioredoxin 1
MINLTSENFETEISKSDVPVVVDFWAAWCGPCRAIAPLFEEASKSFEGKVKFVKCDLEEYQEIADKLSISSIPTLIVFKNGSIHERQVGVASLANLKGLAERSL